MDSKVNQILLLVLIILIGFMCFSVLKNISYPLLWNDELECVTHGERILEFGFPKVHDGKNVLNPMRHSNKKLAIDEATDAYIGLGWTMCYYATIGIVIAEKTDDIYTKSAILRIPFAILGLLGLGILAISFLPFFDSTKEKLIFLIFFTVLCLISMSLVLHIREVRYYSLIIFLGASLINVYIRYRFFDNISYIKYCVITILLLWLLFNTFVPAYLIFTAFLGAYETFKFFDLLTKRHFERRGIDYPNPKTLFKEGINNYLRDILPLIAAFILIIPLVIFFKTLYISAETSKFYHFTTEIYYHHIFSIIEYFANYEFIYFALLIKLALFALYRRNSHLISSNSLRLKIDVSNFLTLFFVIYTILNAAHPSHIYTRYIIFLIPTLATIISLDVLLFFNLLKIDTSVGNDLRGAALALLIPIFLLNGFNKVPEIKGHIYEMFHQYKGPLDYLIPYIMRNYSDTESLVIATNYEECAYMYYLKSKVTFGFNLNNLEEDMTIVPDMIIYRKGWAWNFSPEVFTPFLRKANYSTEYFPVFDYPTNTISDLQIENRHLYQTKFAQNRNEEVELLYRVRRSVESNDK